MCRILPLQVFLASFWFLITVKKINKIKQLGNVWLLANYLLNRRVGVGRSNQISLMKYECMDLCG
ncbi:MAG TPA: hypothetical protein DIW64_20395 [Cellvibrio sp.]|nr:hypothetical protein [Cellvibrio sp.]